MSEDIQEGEGAVEVSQSNLDGMSMEQLDTLMQGEQAEQKGEAVEKNAAQETQQEEKPQPAIADVLKLLEEQGKKLGNFEREFGRLRAIQSKLDKANNPADTKNQLSQEQQAELKQAEEFLEKFITKKYGHLIEGAEQQAKDAEYKGEVIQLAGGEKEAKQLDPLMASMIEEASKADAAGNEAAGQWLEKVFANPAFLVIQAQRQFSQQLKAKESAMEEKRLSSAKIASSTLKTGNRPVTKGDPTQADFDKMSTEELGKFLDEAEGKVA